MYRSHWGNLDAWCLGLLMLLTASNSVRAFKANSQNNGTVTLKSATPKVSELSFVGIHQSTEPVQRTIKGGEVQKIPFELLAGQSRRIVIGWQGLDLNVQIVLPDGTSVFAASVPIRGWGALPITIVAENSGTHTIQVQTTEQLGLTGYYTLLFEPERPITVEDTKRFRAMKLMTEGDRELSKQSAIKKYAEAVELWEFSGDLFGKAFGLLRLGNASLAIKDVSAAEKYYQEVIRLREKLDVKESSVYTLRQIGLDYRALNSPSIALQYYDLALKLARDTANRRAEASTLYSMGFAHARSGRMRLALGFYEQAYAIQQQMNDRLSEANTLMAMGGAYNGLSDQAQALTYFQLAAPIFAELNDQFRSTVALNNIGLAYDDLGSLQEAHNHYLLAQSKYETMLNGGIAACQVGASDQILTICNSWANVSDNIGELYNTTGESESALQMFSRTLSIRRFLGQPQSLGSTLSRICYSHVLQGRFPEALAECNEAIVFNRKAEDLRGSASTLTFLGMTYVGLNKPAEAMASYDEAIRLQRDAGERRGEGITLNQYGLLYRSLREPDRAREKFDEALKLWRDTKDEDGETITLYNIARVEADRGNLSVALDHIQTAIRIIESRRATLSSQKLLGSYFANKQNDYELNIDLQMQLGLQNGSSDSIGEALGTNEHARARQLLGALSTSQVLKTANSNESNPEITAAINRKSELQLLLRSKANSRSVLLSGTHTPEELSLINNEIEKLTTEYDHIESRIRTLAPAFASLSKPQPIGVKEIQASLDDDTVLIEYSLGEKRSYVWVVAQDSVKGFQLSARKEIEPTANRLVKALTARNYEEPKETFQQRIERVNQADKDYRIAAEELSKLILEPVAATLGQKRLVIVADGALQFVPFAGLPLPSTLSSSPNAAGTARATLIDQHEIVSLPSASVLAVQRRELVTRTPAPHRIAILADPVFDAQDERVRTQFAAANRHRKGVNASDKNRQTMNQTHVAASKSDNMVVNALRDIGVNADGSLRRLAKSRSEATEISHLVSGNDSLIALDFKASRATAMSGELSNYQYLHFATHGVLSLEHPELSGIALSMVDEKGEKQDGYLRLYEIYNLNLPAELVVLSACETGVGKQIRGEGLIALTRGFMYAGAKRVVASLWKVDDSATAALMVQFYKEMFARRKRPAAALQAAQIEIAKQKRWQHPYYWAGFVLQGEWR